MQRLPDIYAVQSHRLLVTLRNTSPRNTHPVVAWKNASQRQHSRLLRHRLAGDDSRKRRRIEACTEPGKLGGHLTRLATFDREPRNNALRPVDSPPEECL